MTCVKAAGEPQRMTASSYSLRVNAKLTVESKQRQYENKDEKEGVVMSGVDVDVDWRSLVAGAAEWLDVLLFGGPSL